MSHPYCVVKRRLLYRVGFWVNEPDRVGHVVYAFLNLVLAEG